MSDGSTEHASVGTAAGTPPRGNGFAGDVWATVLRWVAKTVRNPTTTLVEVLVGVLSLVLFSAVFGDVGGLALEQAGYGDVAYTTYLLPAVCVQVAMGSSFTAAIGLVEDVESGMFEKVVASPMRWSAVLAGKAIADLARIAGQVTVVVLVALGLGATVETGAAGVLGVVALAVLVALVFVGLATVVGVLTRDAEALNAASMLVMFPLLFLSPAFVPVADEIEFVAALNPVTYGVTAIRAVVLGRDVGGPGSIAVVGGLGDAVVPAVAVLGGLALALGGLSVWLLGRLRRAGTA